MGWTEDDVMAAAKAIELAHDAVGSICHRFHKRAARAALAAVEHRLQPRGGFAVTDELARIAHKALSEDDIHKSMSVFDAHEALKAVSAHLASQAEKQAPESERVLDRVDSPWPLRDILAKLVEAGEHLLVDHDCDAHGHELYRSAVDSGKSLLADLDGQPEPERVPGPFALADREIEARETCRSRGTADIYAVRLVSAIDRALRTLGPTEREKELERELASAKERADFFSEANDSQAITIGKLQTEIAELRKRTSEPEGDRLDDEQRGYVEHVRRKPQSSNFEKGLVSILDEIAPPPKPADPLEQLLAGWESLTGNAAIVWGEAAKSVREALRAKESGNG